MVEITRDMTQKEVADLLKVDKSKIKYRCKKLPDKYLVKRGNVNYIRKQGIEEIIKDMGVDLPSDYPKKSINNYPKYPLDSPLLERTIDMLQKELEFKNKQIDDLNKRLEETTSALNNSHKLISQQQSLSLIEKNEIKNNDQPNEIKKSFFKRIFGR